MGSSGEDKAREDSRQWIGATLSVPAAPEVVYASVLAVERFPNWAAGVRRVEVVRQSEPPHAPGMVSEWEVSVMNVRRRILSVLETADPPRHLRWSYTAVLHGWGECRLHPRPPGTLVEFATEFHLRERSMDRLLHSAFAENIARHYLRRSLLKLGELSLPPGADPGGVRVGSLTGRRTP